MRPARAAASAVIFVAEPAIDIYVTARQGHPGSGPLQPLSRRQDRLARASAGNQCQLRPD
jgi:hypothetical protein